MLACSAIAALISAPALAADFGAIVPTEVTPVSQSYNWTGGYIGGHLGWAWDSAGWTNTSVGSVWGLVGSGATLRSNGIIGGAQIGYLHQSQNNVVFGVDLSISGSNLSETIISPAFPLTDIWTTELNYFLLLQAKLGWARDRWLGFIQGGYAGGDGKAVAQCPAACAPFSDSKWHNGWTVGAGFSYKVTQQFSFGAEYNYVDLGSQTYNLSVPTFAASLADIDHEVHVIKFTGSYHFGGP